MESKLSFDSGKQQMHQVYALYSDMYLCTAVLKRRNAAYADSVSHIVR